MTTAQPDPDDHAMALLCKALGNPVRIQIIRYIQHHPNCIATQILLHMPDGAPHAQSTISQHLRVLRDAGLVEGYHEGAATCYQINRERLGWLVEQLNQL
ncbi:transcriptional regulator, ArsR family [Oscillochloris trichoides DG-6]|uniref:Transcriptional regulator, ArsR family n=1 Tax=Oscillochloris trichoides DG-6 TaxID=765420 RepID=E1IFV4_9CHLR|nr:metalloregulator ArsR/SmtB family transcription factor [Oscillochloris trichoides]EFO79912.1 transcriptional regulator, ArsR family [Oscillochloris trichoides DG-6]